MNKLNSISIASFEGFTTVKFQVDLGLGLFLFNVNFSRLILTRCEYNRSNFPAANRRVPMYRLPNRPIAHGLVFGWDSAHQTLAYLQIFGLPWIDKCFIIEQKKKGLFFKQIHHTMPS
jgi:hypothetical protein